MPSKIHTLLGILVFTACSGPVSKEDHKSPEAEIVDTIGLVKADPSIYASVKLTTDLSKLNEAHKKMIPILISAAQIMDTIFWMETWGRPTDVPEGIMDKDQERYFALNYGPWDRMNANAPFIDGVGAKPLGARFYPEDMTKAEFDAFSDPNKSNLYTLVRRNDARELITVPYHEAFKGQVGRAATLLEQAAELATDKDLKHYLQLRANALRTDEYKASDLAWLDMKSNRLEVIIGPIETYEDQLFGYKAAHESYIAVKDMEWSKRLERFAAMLPELQKGLPVPAKYKAEAPGSDSQLGAYDVIYYAGDCNSGGKTIAVNLPNDEEVQLEKGTRRLQFKNAMQAKFDKIMMPISKVLIAPEQRSHITFDAFFQNTMFHEVAHGLGIKNTINGKGMVREALLEQASALEEGKADILGLYMITALAEQGELEQEKLMDNYVTFMAGIFRSVRFGASSAHGRANMLRFNFFSERGAFQRDAKTGNYSIDMERMRSAMEALSEVILTLQGNGDAEGVRRLMDEKGNISEQLRVDLERLEKAAIPVDVHFEQGAAVLGL